ncbi:unnamed protein product [Soboliphyme baturini]|uniref:Uncharacterized protein n=1 Tax=Soboliphyme baturini TaxID=241478 RepID=A0A183JAB8_9BILA|nr:unnamed protein product [Soboliphyme baturini]
MDWITGQWSLFTNQNKYMNALTVKRAVKPQRGGVNKTSAKSNRKIEVVISEGEEMVERATERSSSAERSDQLTNRPTHDKPPHNFSQQRRPLPLVVDVHSQSNTQSYGTWSSPWSWLRVSIQAVGWRRAQKHRVILPRVPFDDSDDWPCTPKASS